MKLMNLILITRDWINKKQKKYENERGTPKIG